MAGGGKSFDNTTHAFFYLSSFLFAIDVLIGRPRNAPAWQAAASTTTSTTTA